MDLENLRQALRAYHDHTPESVRILGQLSDAERTVVQLVLELEEERKPKAAGRPKKRAAAKKDAPALAVVAG